jgi:Glycine rich protein/Abnormal spindle-like microcephaly-assoc'd, ASPM-SPD-2-Hydin
MSLGRGQVGALARSGLCAVAVLVGAGVSVATARADSFGFTGAEQAYVVPAGVTAVQVDATGAAGGNGCITTTGGDGATITADFAVSSGSVLYVEVGGNGGSGIPGGICSATAAVGGFNGGGAGGVVGGGGGGGASDVRTVPAATLSPLGSRLIVAAGGGGAGSFGSNGGNAGSAAGGAAGGGGAATLIAGGAAGTTTCGTAATAGSFGGGGAGYSDFPQNGGGGGGGGYFGGGGGGSDSGGTCSNNGYGGGGGSSYVAPAATAATSPVATGAAAGITITPLTAVASVSPSTLSFGTVTQGSIGSPQTITLTNNGNGPLTVTGLSFAGDDPGDFLISASTCLGPVPAGSSCQLAVRFAPQAQGAGSGTLQIAASGTPALTSVTLVGTGTAPLTGPAGSPGPTGATGATGPQGPAGKVELVTCTQTTKEVKGHKHTHTTCNGRLASGTVNLRAGGAVTSATVTRGGVVYATGSAVSLGNGRVQLVLADRRPLRKGTYTLSQRHRVGQRWVTQRSRITLR